MGILSSIQRLALLPSAVIGTAISKAIGLKKILTVEQNISKIQKTLPGKILGTGIALTTAALAVAAPTGRLALKSLIPKTLLGKAVAETLIGAAIVSPTLAGAIIESPITFVSGGQAIGQEIERQTAAGTSVTKAGATGLIIGAVGGLLAPQIKRFFGSTPTPSILTPPGGGSTMEPSMPGLPGSGQLIPPETQQIPSSRRRKHRIKQLEAPRQIISQRVAVHVGVNAGNRKYIKMRHYN